MSIGRGKGRSNGMIKKEGHMEEAKNNKRKKQENCKWRKKEGAKEEQR